MSFPILRRSSLLVIFGFALATLLFRPALAQDARSGDDSKGRDKIDLSRIPDGTYRGEMSFEDGWTLEVDVTVKGYQITRIEVDEDDLEFLQKPEVLIDRVLHAQSVEVDAVSGATASTTILLSVIRGALQKAVSESE
jgi:uncharacterized protein with FMN-binding domain